MSTAETSSVATSGVDRTKTEGIVLAGEYHWAASLFHELRPRPLLPVAGTPIIDYVLRWFRTGGIHDTIICANGSTSALRRYLNDGRRLAMDVNYYEDGTPRGAAGCVRDAAQKSQAQTLIVTDGGSIPVFDLKALLAHHREREAALTIAVYPRGSAGVQQYEPVGVYVFEREVLEAVPATSFQDIKEALIPKLHLQGHRVEAFPVRDRSPRVLNADSYLAVNHWMTRRLTAEPGASNQVVSGRDVSVHETARMIGPVVLGDGVRVGPGATIVGPTCLGEGTEIGAEAVITRSVTWTDATIEAQAVVDSCILADRTRVAGGATLVSQVRSGRSNGLNLFGRMSGLRS
jgi:mannose-1-phosphate guanylyltransferase